MNLDLSPDDKIQWTDLTIHLNGEEILPNNPNFPHILEFCKDAIETEQRTIAINFAKSSFKKLDNIESETEEDSGAYRSQKHE